MEIITHWSDTRGPHKFRYLLSLSVRIQFNAKLNMIVRWLNMSLGLRDAYGKGLQNKTSCQFCNGYSTTVTNWQACFLGGRQYPDPIRMKTRNFEVWTFIEYPRFSVKLTCILKCYLGGLKQRWLFKCLTMICLW